MLELVAEWARQDELPNAAATVDGTGQDWYLCGQTGRYWLAVVEQAIAEAGQPRAGLVDDEFVVEDPPGPTWMLLALHGVLDAITTTDPAELRAKLLTAAAVFPRWIEDLDQRAAPVGTGMTGPAPAVAADVELWGFCEDPDCPKEHITEVGDCRRCQLPDDHPGVVRMRLAAAPGAGTDTLSL